MINASFVLVPTLAQCKRLSNEMLSTTNIVPYPLTTMTRQKSIGVVLSIVKKKPLEGRPLKIMQKTTQTLSFTCISIHSQHGITTTASNVSVMLIKVGLMLRVI
jgi:hypothetical protein